VRSLRWITVVGCLLVAGCAGATSPPAIPASQDPGAGSRPMLAVSTDAVAVVDNPGDARTAAGQPGPGHLDVVAAKVVKTGDGSLAFDLTLASALAAAPGAPESGTSADWAVCIDLYPFVVSPLYGQLPTGMPCQLIVRTLWDGTRLSGQVLDRRAVGAGVPASAEPFVPSVEGASIRMSVPAESLGGPSWFLWSVYTEELGSADPAEVIGARGPNAAHHVDAAPDGGVGAPLVWTGVARASLSASDGSRTAQARPFPGGERRSHGHKSVTRR